MAGRRAHIRSRAATDVDDVIAYLLREAGESVASAFVDSLEHSLKQIKRSPNSGTSQFAYELGIPELRAWPLRKFSYVVFYLPVHDGVKIWRVLHTSRDIPTTVDHMAGFEAVRVAAVQATPVILDADATIDKAIDLIGEAVDGGATLVVFPECFVSVYPSGAWAAPAATWAQGCDELWERMWQSSVDVRGPLVGRLAAACAERGVHVAIGVNEREDDRPGSLYNTLLVIGGEGVLHRHRKLMPTMHERVFHGMGAGDDLDVVELPGGARVGGLICWENRMPLARWNVYQGGPQIWLAPTADDSDGWIASMRHIAIEAGAFVVSVPQYIPASAFPDDFPLALPDGVDVFGRGGACVVSPSGEVIAGPMYDAEGIVFADCDLREALHSKRYFDVVGHYGRGDVLVPARPA